MDLNNHEPKIASFTDNDVKSLLTRINKLEEDNKKLVRENNALTNEKAVLAKEKDALLSEKEALKEEFYYQRLMIDELLKLVEKKDFQRVSQVLRSYGIKSEKTSTIANEPEVIEETASKKEKEKAKEFEEKIKKRAKPGRKKGTKNFDKYDESKLVINDKYLESEDTICPSCGETMIANGEKVQAKLIYHPGYFELLRTHIMTYICPFCGDKEVDKSIDIFDDNIVTPSFASNIINLKYNYAIPLYRQADIYARDGLPISRVSLSKYAQLAAEALTPLYNLMIKDLVSTESKVLQADETSFKCIMDCKGEEREKNYVYVYATTYHDSPIRIYSYNKSRTADNPLDVLKDFSGYLECDGYGVYNNIPNVKVANCWAHARRKYVDIIKTKKSGTKKSSLAFKYVKIINKLFKIEKDAKKKKASTDELLKIRKKLSKPIVDEYFDDIKKNVDSMANPLYDAMKYSLNQEEGLRMFLEDACIPIDNNLSERAVKPFVIMRKNALFAYSKLGAMGSCVLMSVVQTAKENFLDVKKYLTYVLEKLNTAKLSELKDLLPYSDKLPKELIVKVK